MRAKEPVYKVKCNLCGWQGSSEGPDDQGRYTCPQCHKGEPEELDELWNENWDARKEAGE